MRPARSNVQRKLMMFASSKDVPVSSKTHTQTISSNPSMSAYNSTVCIILLEYEFHGFSGDERIT